MVISESKKRVMISLTKEQDKKLTDMAKQKGFSKSAARGRLPALGVRFLGTTRERRNRRERFDLQRSLAPVPETFAFLHVIRHLERAVRGRSLRPGARHRGRSEEHTSELQSP